VATRGGFEGGEANGGVYSWQRWTGSGRSSFHLPKKQETHKKEKWGKGGRDGGGKSTLLKALGGVRRKWLNEGKKKYIYIYIYKIKKK
jgi:hypothetical protein